MSKGMNTLKVPKTHPEKNAHVPGSRTGLNTLIQQTWLIVNAVPGFPSLRIELKATSQGNSLAVQW